MSLKFLERVKTLSILATMTFGLGCFQAKVGDLKMESKSVELGKAETVRVEVDIGVGELKLGAGTKKLLEADFLFNVAQWKPELRYDVQGGQGVLTIKQLNFGTTAMGNARNEWNLFLNNKVPIYLKIQSGVGRSNFDLGGFMLTGLEVQTGVGETTLDLLGDWKKDLHASIKSGIGQLTLRLPDKVGVRVQAEKAIGAIRTTGLRREENTYLNDAYGKSKVTLDFQVQAGIGEIRLESGG